jgi:hypothetical protein
MCNATIHEDGWYGRNNCRLASSLINFLVNSCVRQYFIATILLVFKDHAMTHAYA